MCLQPLHSQGLPESAGDEKETSQGDERVATPAPHEPSAEMRETCGQAGTRLLVGEGGGEVGRVAVSVELDRTQSQGLDRGGPITHETGEREECVYECTGRRGKRKMTGRNGNCEVFVAFCSKECKKHLACHPSTTNGVEKREKGIIDIYY